MTNQTTHRSTSEPARPVTGSYSSARVDFKVSLCLFLALAGCQDLPLEQVGKGQPPSYLIASQPTGEDYFQNVVLTVGRRDATTAWEPVCTGTVVAPDLVLTAAHCIVLPQIIAGLREFGVMLSSEFSTSHPVIPVTTSHLHPDFFLYAVTPAEPIDNFDIALHVLERPVDVQPAHLPPPGLLDHLPASAPLTVVGYGKTRPDAGFYERGVRMAGTVRVMQQWEAGIGTSASPSAVCFGDSGGPLLRGGEDALHRRYVTMILALALNGDCTSWSTHYRLDTPQARAFLGKYLKLPG